MILLFLAAIATANLIVAHFGPPAVIPVGFTLVGFDLIARDVLHDRWRGRNLPLRMGALIAAGGVVAYLVNADAGQIAVASVLAFVSAQAVNAFVYWLVGHWPRLTRMNTSNAPAAVLDSAVFLTVAFGAFMPGLIAAQIAAKWAGGFVWSLVFAWRPRRRREAEARWAATVQRLRRDHS